MDPQAVHCVFFLKRACKKGAACPFLHDNSLFEKVQTAKVEGHRSTPCIFYQKGFCMKGDACPFSHGAPQPRPQEAYEEQEEKEEEVAEKTERSGTKAPPQSSFQMASSYQAPGFGAWSSGVGAGMNGSGGSSFGGGSTFTFGKQTLPTKKKKKKKDDDVTAAAATSNIVHSRKEDDDKGQGSRIGKIEKGDEKKEVKRKHKKITWKSSSSSKTSGPCKAAAGAASSSIGQGTMGKKRKLPQFAESHRSVGVARKEKEKEKEEVFVSLEPKKKKKSATITSSPPPRAVKEQPLKPKVSIEKAAVVEDDDFDKVLDEFDF